MEKATLLNDFFAKVTHVEDNRNVIPPIPQTPPIVNNLLSEIVISEQEVLDQLKILKTNKSYGPDGISPKLLKEAGSSISLSLSKLFNASLSTGIFPAPWKLANVHPIYKKNDPALITNYRPVSLLNIISKIFEKIVFKYLYNHLLDNTIITPFQSGFLPGVSTVSQLVEIIHNLHQDESWGKESRIVFLDISKAFDRVWHPGLIFKLKRYGVHGILLDWINDYISSRKQRVLINGRSSDWVQLKGGVPQGSVLGPLLFLVFINDITEVVEDCKIRLFADDTCLIKTGKNPVNIAQSLESDLRRIDAWAQNWLIDFSPAKTESLIISKKLNLDRHPVIMFGNLPIQEVATHKHLGITISRSLHWSNHIDSVISSSSAKLNLMRVLKFRLDRCSLERIYTSFIRPKLEYGNILFAGSPKCHLDKLDKVELDAFRIISGATKGCPTLNIIKELGLPTLLERRKLHVLSTLYKYHFGPSPLYISDILANYVRTPVYGLRNISAYKIPMCKTEGFKNSFFPLAINYWNSLEDSTRESENINFFKSKICPKRNSNHFKLLYYGERWPNIHHARIRMGCSRLNHHLHRTLHVIDSSECACGYPTENPEHFFLNCPIYDALRLNLLYVIDDVRADQDIETLLYGDANISFEKNKRIFSAVHKYIVSSKRFVSNFNVH
jgi:hypothetical protein